jgi:hypothetical protein
MTGLSWNWIAVMALVPLPLGVLVAVPFWRSQQMILGNLAGTAAIFVVALLLMFREHAQLDRVTQACLNAGVTCWPEPPAFTRFAIFAAIGLLEVFALFLFSLRVERRAMRQRYAPEWR